MKFAISRTSIGHMRRGEKPYEGCTWETLAGHHEQDTPWVRGVWVLEIDTLEDLLALKQAAGYELVLTDEYASGLPEIEIYDNYRE